MTKTEVLVILLWFIAYINNGRNARFQLNIRTNKAGFYFCVNVLPYIQDLWTFI